MGQFEIIGTRSKPMREIKTFPSPTGRRCVHLYEHENGFFSFEESYETSDDLTEFGGEVITYWAPGYASGLYDSAEAAEREARAMTPWLREDSN